MVIFLVFDFGEADLSKGLDRTLASLRRSKYDDGPAYAWKISWVTIGQRDTELLSSPRYS